MLGPETANLLIRHATVGVTAGVLTYGFWLSRPRWSDEMQLWRAVGDASLILLVLTLAIGPVSRLWPATRRIIPWRRETGVWYGVLAVIHTALILDGWVRWDFMRFFGYEFIPQLERYARLEPGFGLANTVGLTAVGITVILLATSSTWAVNLLGPSAWKWLQYGAYVVFYLVVLHTFYFLFLHYTASFHRPVPDDANWFRIPFLILAGLVVLLQALAYLKTVLQRARALDNPQQRKGVGSLEPPVAIE